MSDELRQDYPKRYWDAANVVAAFGAAQSLAFLFAFTSNCTVRITVVQTTINHTVAVAAVLFSLVVYALVLQWCHHWELALLTEPTSKASNGASKALDDWVLKAPKQARSGRMAVVAGLHTALVVVLLSAFLTPPPGPGCP